MNVLKYNGQRSVFGISTLMNENTKSFLQFDCIYLFPTRSLRKTSGRKVSLSSAPVVPEFRPRLLRDASIAIVGVRSKTLPDGYSVFLSYESSMCKTAIEHPRVPFSNASLTRYPNPAPTPLRSSFLLKNGSPSQKNRFVYLARYDIGGCSFKRNNVKKWLLNK